MAHKQCTPGTCLICEEEATHRLTVSERGKYWVIEWSYMGIDDQTTYTDFSSFIRALEMFREDKEISYLKWKEVEFAIEKEPK